MAPGEMGRVEVVLGKKTEIGSIQCCHVALGLWREMVTLCRVALQEKCPMEGNDVKWGAVSP